MENQKRILFKKIYIYFIIILSFTMLKQCIMPISANATESYSNYQANIINHQSNKMKKEVTDSIVLKTMKKEASSIDSIENEYEGTQIQLSDEERLWLAKIIYAESGICGLDEQIAVGKTILNRMEKYNMTIYEVITSKGQFSSVINGEVYLITSSGNILVTEDIISDRSWEAVETVLSGEQTLVEKLLMDEAIRLGLDVQEYAEGGPMFFVNVDAVKNKEYYNSLTCKVKIGYQTFYKAPY